MTSYTPKTYASGDTLPATDMTALNAAVGSLATESVAVVPRARIGSGTPAAGMYVDGGTGAWTALPDPGGGGSDPTAVKLTGDQTITGVKTFTAAPVVPDSAFTVAKTIGLQAALDGRAPTTRTITAGTGLAGGGDLTANRTLAVSYGTTAGTAAQGNDTRLSDARTPTSHAASHASGGADALAISGAQVTSGTIPPARLATGVPVAGAYVDGTGAWTALPAVSNTTVTWDGAGAAPERPAADSVTWIAPQFPTTASVGDVLIRS